MRKEKRKEREQNGQEESPIFWDGASPLTSFVLFTPAFFLCLHSLIAWNRLTSLMLPFITPRIWLLSFPSSWYKFQWKINYKNLVLLVGKDNFYLISLNTGSLPVCWTMYGYHPKKLHIDVILQSLSVNFLQQKIIVIKKILYILCRLFHLVQKCPT